MALLILMPGRDSRPLARILQANAPDLDIRIWPETGNETGNDNDIEYVITWNHPAGELTKYPNLKVVASFGAGVDHIFQDPHLPENITITRLVDNSLSRQMCEYVAGVILAQRLRLIQYREYQAAGVWRESPAKAGNNVCLLGLGNIGLDVAQYLNRLHFTVSGWSQSPKDINNITSFHGKHGLTEAIENADYIVCLLPLTPETENILNMPFFNKLKKGAFLINVGRGGHLDEDGLLDALTQDKVSGACLDVFRTEPLPDDHPFWKHPRIYLTPHSASLTNIDDAAIQFLENYRNMVGGQPLINQVDPVKGY